MNKFDWQPVFDHDEVGTLLGLALAEDIGDGDVTTRSIFAEAQPESARIVCRTPAVICGLPVAAEIFRRIDAKVTFAPQVAEGDEVEGGTVLATVRGDIRSLLTAERCALNFLMRLCGVASATRRTVDAIPAGSKTRIYDTRKTLPGWRYLDKMAVRVGGGENHRVGLFDMVLIKDNHIAAAGGVVAAIERSRARAPAGMVIEVEVDTLDQLDQALSASPDIILLDNFDDGQLSEAVRRTAGRAQLEASGGVTLERIAAIARTGVDRISLGALTHTVVPADVALDYGSD